MRKLGEFLKEATQDVYEVDATGLPGAPAEPVAQEDNAEPYRFVITFRDPKDSTGEELDKVRNSSSSKDLAQLLIGELEFPAAWAVLGKLKQREIADLLDDVQDYFRKLYEEKDKAEKLPR